MFITTLLTGSIFAGSDRYSIDPVQSAMTNTVIPDQSKTNKIDPLKFKNFCVYLETGYCLLFAGTFYNNIHDGLIPVPDKIYNYVLGVGLEIFPTYYFGVDAGYVIDTIYAGSAKVSNSLQIGSFHTFKALGVLRIPFYQSESISALFLKFYLGPSLSLFDLSADYKSMALSSAEKSGYNISFYDRSEVRLGFTGGIGLELQYYDFDAGLNCFIQNKNVRFSGANDDLSAYECGLYLRMGFIL